MNVFCLRWLIVYSPIRFLVLGNCLCISLSSIVFMNFIICFRLLVPYVKSDAIFEEPTSELCEIETSNSGYIVYIIVIWCLLLPPVYGSKLRSKAHLYHDHIYHREEEQSGTKLLRKFLAFIPHALFF